MSLELFNASIGLTRTFSREFAAQALELARCYGWRPRGTRPPEAFNSYALNADWFGLYLTNDGQMVTAEDARALAEALECALQDIPDEDVKMEWSPKLWADDLPEWLAPYERELVEDGLQEHAAFAVQEQPFAFFAGAEKQYLMRFIRFCRLGSFVIL
jgi:hypothetical protein